MSTTISGLSSLWTTSQAASSTSRASKMAEDLFSALDTSGTGYLTESQFASAFGNLTSSSSGSTSSVSASDVFSALDSDGDGKLTQSELSNSLSQISDQLDSQFANNRLDQARGNMPPPPPPTDGNSSDQGLTEDQMTQMLSGTSSSDPLYSDLTTALANFGSVDANGDGKVTFDEIQAYKQSTGTDSSASSSVSTATSTSSSSDSTSSSSTTTASNDAAIMKQLLDLLSAYGYGPNASSSISLTA